MSELSQARESIGRLTKEKESLSEERNQMLALIQSKGTSKVADALIEENRRLKGLLDEANAKVATLSKDKATAQKEATELREQVARVRDELERAKKENDDYRQQVATLRARLEQTSEQLLAAPAGNRPDSEVAEENRLLRKMILDQLKHQSYREQKKRLALEQLARLQINNDELLGTINELAAPPPGLSADEKGVLQDPQMNAFMEGRGIGATIIARTDGTGAAQATPAADEGAARPPRGRQELSPDLQTVADAGIQAFRRNRAWEAERAFATILKSDPTNVYALSNVAVAQLKQGKFGETERNLKKALAYQENDAFAHHLLGLAAYRQGKFDEAERSLKIALGFDARNARAHFTLGLVHNRRGQIDRACGEFLQAVEADPAYADAHYNLAVIYANQNEIARAVSHYNKALENGSERDPKLERTLGQPLGAR
jgi:tetratricopeptide (TPR) repeat protein